MMEDFCKLTNAGRVRDGTKTRSKAFCRHANSNQLGRNLQRAMTTNIERTCEAY